MTRFIVLTFAFLGWAFYEMSGGSGFEPASARLTDIKVDPLKPATTTAVVSTRNAVEPVSEETTFDPKDVQVTRVSLNLTSVEDVLSGKTNTEETRQQTAATDETEVSGATLVQASLDADADVQTPSIIPSLVAGADPQVTAPQTEASVTSVGGDLREVKGNRVNVRGGPGTNYDVVGRLVRGNQVEIVEDLGNGWIRMQSVDGSVSGWVADFLLTASR